MGICYIQQERDLFKRLLDESIDMLDKSNASNDKFKSQVKELRTKVKAVRGAEVINFASGGSVRFRRTLEFLEVSTVEELACLSAADILACRGSGITTVREAERLLTRHGLKLRID